ncbi:MAG: methyltransferase domain-containing protein [Candidatus Babeliaceae bacterium]|nr:methyltransferase domain-containing protein [Candidatus Babeliaceae bacterium]
MAVPRKDIELAFCSNCGFIFNSLFDVSVDYFTMGYEDQQGFSATFMEYLTRISKALIEKYDLKGKRLLEIGCGKGDFINLLTELTGGQGIGVDPAYIDGRQKNKNVTFYKELFSEDHRKLNPDFICCRHTLEHVHDTRNFMRVISQSISSDQRPIIFFEVPQINRILDVLAFWDIYYEHCSYFNATSMAYLFRNAGFDILDMQLDYSDQYLLVEAVPATGARHMAFPLEESIDVIRERVNQFRDGITTQLNVWRKRLEGFKKNKNKVVVWGGGSKSVGFLTQFADLAMIDYVVDINPNMEGNYIPGIGSRYVQPEFLKEFNPDVVIIMNGIYRNEIVRTMADMGVTPQVFSL